MRVDSIQGIRLSLVQSLELELGLLQGTKKEKAEEPHRNLGDIRMLVNIEMRDVNRRERSWICHRCMTMSPGGARNEHTTVQV